MFYDLEDKKVKILGENWSASINQGTSQNSLLVSKSNLALRCPFAAK